EIVVGGEPAGEVVLDDADRRSGEVRGGGPGGYGVEVVVVRHLLAAQDSPGGDASCAARVQQAVDRRFLVWVLAVAQHGHALPGQRQVVREFAGRAEVCSDHAVVGRHVRECLGSQV